MDRITDAFAWPVRDPEWVVKLLIIGLTLLIPIVGQINSIGWMLATIDRLRAGDQRLAPANLDYIGRGVKVWVVQIVYVLALALLALIFYVPGLALAIHQGNGSGNVALLSSAVLLNLLAFGVVSVGSLAITFALPAIVLTTDRGGIAAGLHPLTVWRLCRANLTYTLIAGLMLIAAGFVSSLGLVACGIGVLFTNAYALAMQAWIIHSFELGDKAGAPA